MRLADRSLRIQVGPARAAIQCCSLSQPFYFVQQRLQKPRSAFLHSVLAVCWLDVGWFCVIFLHSISSIGLGRSMQLRAESASLTSKSDSAESK